MQQHYWRANIIGKISHILSLTQNNTSSYQFIRFLKNQEMLRFFFQTSHHIISVNLQFPMSKPNDSYDFLVKVVIIGDSAVGKTNILLRYTDDLYRATHTATIGVDFKVKTLNVGGTKIKMQIWDTAGQDRFRNITKTYYKGSAGVVFVYSITDRKSFQNLENWIKQVQENQSNDIAKIILGNKIDCNNEGRQVTYQEVEKLSAKFGIPFMEVSAKDNINIQQAFMKMGQLIKENHKENQKEIDSGNKAGTHLQGQGSKKKNCQC